MLQAHFNLCDLLDSTRQGGRVRLFACTDDLSWFTIRTGTFFPRGNAYAGGLLKYLLREITAEGVSEDRVSEGSEEREEAANSKGKEKKFEYW